MFLRQALCAVRGSKLWEENLERETGFEPATLSLEG
jgi:hypothetical protein